MMKKILIVGFILLSMCFLGMTVSAEIALDDIEFDPASPSALSDVTVTTTFSGVTDNDNVYLIIKECDADTGICNQPMNNSMVKANEAGIYTLDVSLSFTSATYFDYWFEISSEGTWTELKDISYRINYTETPDDNGDTTNGDSDNETPGFEILTLLLAIVVSMIVLRRKR